MTPVQQQVCRLVSDVFGLSPEEVTLKTSHDTVEKWDSLNIVHLMMAVEAEFGVEITPDDAVDFLSVELVCAILGAKGVA